tara:strand:+ start:577 stop:801 length:225 start_codon:yes stop_codon:yes gene_type:complete
MWEIDTETPMTFNQRRELTLKVLDEYGASSQTTDITQLFEKTIEAISQIPLLDDKPGGTPVEPPLPDDPMAGIF